jgi:hypothetical protein
LWEIKTDPATGMPKGDDPVTFRCSGPAVNYCAYEERRRVDN